MAKTIDYYLSLVSPWTYLGHARLVELATHHNAKINIWPVNLGIIFPATGGLPLPKRAPERRAYRLRELKRWQEYIGIPLNPEPRYFPANERLAAGMVIALRNAQPDAAITLAGAVLRAVWAEQRDISDRDTLLAIASENQLDGTALLAESEPDTMTATIAANSQKAIERGVFGAPSYIYNEELFWGQDRLEFLQRALA